MAHPSDKIDGKGATCPICDSTRSSVIETRSHQHQVIRRRECKCGETYTTIEKTIDASMRDVIIHKRKYQFLGTPEQENAI